MRILISGYDFELNDGDKLIVTPAFLREYPKSELTVEDEITVDVVSPQYNTFVIRFATGYITMNMAKDHLGLIQDMREAYLVAEGEES